MPTQDAAMTLGVIIRFLTYSLLINYAILLVWFLAFILAHGWLKRLHGNWFNLSENSFDAIHYSGMAAYKIGILLFNLAPLIALWLMHNGS